MTEPPLGPGSGAPGAAAPAVPDLPPFDLPEETPPHGVPAVVAPPGRARRAPGRERAGVRRGRGGSGRGRGGSGRGRGGAGRGGRRGRLTRRGKVLLGALGVVVVLAALVLWYEGEANPSGPLGRPVVIDVHHGEATGAVLATLTGDGVIGSSLAFRLWSLVHGTPTIVPGRYLFHRNEPFADVRTLLAAGPNVGELTVAPGYTLAEIASSLSSSSGRLAGTFLVDARHGVVASPFAPAPGTNLEGLIGTGTYEVLPGETARQLLTQMVDRFDAEAKAAGLSATTTVGGLSAYQVVTLASIAQKEGYFERYFGRVSRVIYNRLASGMRLDMTSTVLYSLGKDGGQVTPAEEQLTTPYNTYLHAGLTPTPICTPSRKALAAAVAPPAGTWLYFDLVTAKKGVMVFSSTYTGQVAAQNQAAANAAANAAGGASGSATQ